jgi:peptidyl-prolyl cis-trans isomerase A (cyclophilin A)
MGFFNDSPLFRVIKNFLVQFGMSLNRQLAAEAAELGAIRDDQRDLSPAGKFRRGWVSFAGAGPNTRGNQLFITYKDTDGLGKSPWETPIGRVVEGMDDVVDAFYEVGDMPPWGSGPDPGMIHRDGREYLKKFPKLTYIVDCRIEAPPAVP